jgi:hypothetical protein
MLLTLSFVASRIAFAADAAPSPAPVDPVAAPAPVAAEAAAPTAAEPGANAVAAEAPVTSVDQAAPAPSVTPADQPAPETATTSPQMATAPAVSEPAAAPAPEVVAAAAPAAVETTVASVHQERGLFYFGLGLGFGMGSLSPEAMAGRGAGVLSLRSGLSLGHALYAGVSLAGINQYNAWKQQEHVGSMLSSVMGEVSYFPLARWPLNVAAGLGWGSGMRVDRLADKGEDKDPMIVTASGNGISWMTAVGWDFYSGSSTSLGVQARYDGASLGDALGTVHTGSLQLSCNFY